jgi:hypothetical protein
VQPQGAGGGLRVFRYCLGIQGIGRIDEDRYTGSPGYQISQQPKLLCGQLSIEKIHARDVAARPVEARDKADLYRVRTRGEDDRDCRRRSLCRKCRGCVPRCSDDRHAVAKEIGHQIGYQVEATFRPPVFDRDGLTFNIAGFIQTLPKRGHSPIVRPEHRG